MDSRIGCVCLIIWLEWKFGWVGDLARSDIWLDFTPGWVGDLDGFCWEGYLVGLDWDFDWVGDSVLLEVGDLTGMFFWFCW